MKKGLEKVRIDVPTGEAPVVRLDAWLTSLAADHHFWVFEMKGIVRTSLSEGEHTRDRCSPAPCAAGALLIVLS